MGRNAGASNSTGNSNFASGFFTGAALTTGSNNTFIGCYAGRYNTSGSNNIIIGLRGGYRTTLGGNNIFLGCYAGACNTVGSHNFMAGACAGRNGTTGTHNVFIGLRSGCSNTSGSCNIFIGCYSGSTTTTAVNQIVLGTGATASSATADNEITLGNSSITTIRAQVTSITSLSDQRDKSNIETLGVGLDFLRQVRPVTFTWNMRDGGKIGQKETGFIAQELQQVLNSSSIREWLSDLVISNQDNSRLEAAPGKLLPLVIRAIQELAVENDNLNSKLADTVATVEQLQQKIELLKKST